MQKLLTNRDKVMRKINLIVIHCSATRSNVDFSPEDLDRCHRERGFAGCGYHFYITKDGLVHAMRPVELIGAHARGYNANSIGICYEGGLDPQNRPRDTRTVKQNAMLHALVGRLNFLFNKSIKPPVPKIKRHLTGYATTELCNTEMY